MKKYDPLYDYLRAVPEMTIDLTLSFTQINQILKSNLPKSAYVHRAWWSNEITPKGSHVQCHAWLEAGWKVDTVNLESEWVRFKFTG